MWDLQWSFRLDNIFYTEEKEYKIFWKIDRGKNMVDVYLLKAKEGDYLFVMEMKMKCIIFSLMVDVLSVGIL